MPRHSLPVLAAFILLNGSLLPAVAQEGQQNGADVSASPTSQPASPSTQSASSRTSHRSKAYGARLETDPPGYVRSLSEHAKHYGIEGWEELDWFDFGLEHRTRFESRDDYYRLGSPENRDDQFLLRSRLYFGIHDVVDPLRFGLELEDTRQFMSDFAETNRDVDENDILQAFAELYFEDALGPGYPFRIQAGRMSFDYVDRKLVGRNRFRNTINAFDGFRVQLGQPTSDWQFDFFAVMPVERRLRQLDRPDEERWLYGLVGAWRKWSDYVTLEPYYFILDEDRSDPEQNDREIHTLGLHAFGTIGSTPWDYDIDTAFQFGDDGARDHRGFAAYGELGYTFKHDWRPRLSVSGTYGSGDRDPDDNTSGRFDRMFAPNHFRSTSDLFSWQNTISPKLRLEFRPHKRVRVDGAYGAYWLASDADAWVVPGRRDSAGSSGNFVGQELELRVRYQANDNAEMEAGYSCFLPGTFVENTGPADDSDFFYVAVTLKL